MTTEDKTFIENAAKAMGYEGEWCEVQQGFVYQVPNAGCYLVQLFNPLTSNADCAEMEAQLEISVNWLPAKIRSFHQVDDTNYTVIRFDEVFYKTTDKAAARRRASTRVAAEIAKRNATTV